MIVCKGGLAGGHVSARVRSEGLKHVAVKLHAEAALDFELGKGREMGSHWDHVVSARMLLPFGWSLERPVVPQQVPWR